MYNNLKMKRKVINLTPNKENFIKAIYELGGAKMMVTNKDLATHLEVSAASITDMNARLVKDQIITYTPYRGVELTEKGVAIAKQLIRRHRLWEVFLSEKLGYEWDEIHEDADLLEHISSDKLIERLDAFLNHPKVDPHGDLIPNQDGETMESSLKPLVDYQENDRIIIKQVDDQDDFLKYLTEKNISLGNVYTIIDIDPFEGPYTLQNDEGQKVIISYKATYRIYVKEDRKDDK